MSHCARRLCPALFVLFFAPQAYAQDWQLYQFRANEEFRYDIAHSDDGEMSEGYFELTVRPAGGDRLKINVEGKLGDMECSSSVSVESADAVPQQMMMNCMMIAPVTMVLFGGTWAWFMGRSWKLGDHWSMSHGGESMSFSIERECSHAGQKGMLAVMKQNEEVRLESCVSKDLALPIAVKWREESGESVQITLVRYRR